MALTTFASPHLLDQLTHSVSAGRRTLKRVLVMVGVACVFVALARPQAGYRLEETHRKGLDILFAVDTSKSMLAQDVKPDRLTRAKLAVNDLVDKLDGDDVGLIAFAGDAFLQSPMTLDYDAFRESLNALDTTVIPRGGTDIARAISEAQAAFRTENNHDKILVLVTDGEDLEGGAHHRRRGRGEGWGEDLHRRCRQHNRRVDSRADRKRRDRVRQGRVWPIREIAARRTNAEEDRRGHGRDVSTARPAGRRIDGDLQPGACALPAARRRVAPAARLSRTVPVAIAPGFVLLPGRAFHRHTQTFGASAEAPGSNNVVRFALRRPKPAAPTAAAG